jgi:hypothetical protein
MRSDALGTGAGLCDGGLMQVAASDVTESWAGSIPTLAVASGKSLIARAVPARDSLYHGHACHVVPST